jgi:uncharacterized protein (TIGR02757 family)
VQYVSGHMNTGGALSNFLNQLADRYHRSEFLHSDPLEFVHRYESVEDQELVALIASLLAYGNVKQIRASVAEALSRIERSGSSVHQFADSLQTSEGMKRGKAVLSGFVHRFNRGDDLLWLLKLAGQSRAKYGSVGSHFLHHHVPDDGTFERTLDVFIADWREWAGEKVLRTSFSYLLTAPKDGSCCKRWCMLLRWMGRTDDLDPGLWSENSRLRATFPEGKFLRASQLILPLDTHTGRISQYIGLIRRKSVNWKAALEATEALRSVDANDPARFDFALSRLGILSLCKKSYRAEICERCALLPACRFAQKRRRRARS